MAYNEDAVWQPLHLRRKLLDSWGFRCCCARCVAEADLPRSVQREIEEIVAATGASSDSPGPWRRRYRCAAAVCRLLPCHNTAARDFQAKPLCRCPQDGQRYGRHRGTCSARGGVQPAAAPGGFPGPARCWPCCRRWRWGAGGCLWAGQRAAGVPSGCRLRPDEWRPVCDAAGAALQAMCAWACLSQGAGHCSATAAARTPAPADPCLPLPYLSTGGACSCTLRACASSARRAQAAASTSQSLP